MTKYVVGLSFSTLAIIAVIVGMAVSTVCATMIICSYHPAEPAAIVRPLSPRKVTTPIQLPSQGSIGATKEARLEAEFGPVDTSKTHERKEGFFDRFRRSKQPSYISYHVQRANCPNCNRQPTYSPVIQPAQPAERMPELDWSSVSDGSIALKDVNPFDLTSPLVSPQTCPTCPKAPSIFGN